ncbi:MAG: hypothetical protein WD801_04010 [Gemmatimonadaceae bacterium]
MNALFAWLDVDRVQWRALLGASLRADFAAVRMPNASARGRRMASNIGLSLLVYTVAGLSPAMMAWFANDVLFAGAMMATFVGFMVLSTLLLGEGTAIISPTDYHVLGFRPITSRTYLAVRVSAILVRTAVIASAVALAPVAVFLLKGGLHPARALSALLAAYATGLAVTLAVVAMYGWMLRLAGPARMKRWATYTQFAAQTVAWGGFFIATQGLGQSAMAGVSFSENLWWVLYPGTWFGSYVALGSGTASAYVVISALLSVALIVALGRLIGGKLSLGYAEDLARVSSVASRPTRVDAGGRWLGLLNSETRAVALLVRSHLRHDMKFRMGLVSLVPITMIYLYLGGLPPDPFLPRPPENDGESMLIIVALLFLPPTLRRVLVTSQTHRASWIYFSTPSDYAKLVLSSRNIIAMFFLVPYLAILGGVMVYAFGNVLHAALHTVYIGMISYVVLQFIILISPELPFSLPIDKEAQGGRMIAVMIGSTMTGMVLYVVLTQLVYRSATGMVLFAVAFGLASWLMDRITRRRAMRHAFSYSE